MAPSRKNKQDSLPDHSKEKILLYKTYLENYLSVMCNHPSWKNIHIWEPFAGPGIYKDGGIGSPVEAAEVIQDMREKHPETKIRLLVNELDSKFVNSLQEALKDFNFVSIGNDDAKKFIQAVGKTILRYEPSRTHNLIFIDPYGYKDTSENLDYLIKLNKIDYLIFVPTSHVYRFRDPEFADYKPAKQFLINMGASNKNLKKIDYADDLVKELKANLREKAETEFVYSYKLTNLEAAYSWHHLFFVSRNPRGAEKFLEAIEKVEGNKKIQLDFLFRPSVKDRIRSILKNNELDNKELYEQLLIAGYRSTHANSALKELEKNNDLEVIDLTGKRQRGGYYLDLNKPRVELLFRLAPQE